MRKQDQNTFFHLLLTLAIPIALQNLLITSLNAVDVLMIGSLGDASIAAIGIANQLYFILSYILMGIGGGAAIFTAQLWGKKDLQSVDKMLGLSLKLSLIPGLIFCLLAVCFPQWIFRIYTKDLEVIAIGTPYLRIVGFSYLASTFTFTYSAILRSVHQVKLPLVISFVSILVNTLLNYLFLFGKGGLPRLGVTGVAIATVIARTLELVLYLVVPHLARQPITIQWHLFGLKIPRKLLMRFAKTTLPILLNEVIWPIGMATYSIIYARISTNSLAAINIASTIEALAFVVFIGITNAGAVMIGNQLGAKRLKKAFIYAKYFLLIGFSGGILVGAGLIWFSDYAALFYQVSELTQTYLHHVLIIFGCAFWIKIGNLIIFGAILKSGGDTRFAFALDSGALWLIGIPLASMGAFIFHLSIYWVIVLVMLEELTKLIIGLTRVFSRKWINILINDND